MRESPLSTANQHGAPPAVNRQVGMHSFSSFRSRSAYLTATAAGLWASSTRLETRTVAAPTDKPLSSPRAAKTKEKNKRHSSAGDGENIPPFPAPTGPMVAVFLDQSSVDKLKAQYPEARDGQLRKVVVQYGPSASEREMYRHLFSSRAEVTVTGDASSSGRRALVVSVSHAGGEVKPVSLSAAIDISPQLDMGDAVVPINDGPGPLASTVLIQQIKQAGATKKDLWQGMLSPLLAHNRQFPREEGAYVRLQEPISVSGTICRSDWVDGATTRCRDTVGGGGEKREEDWKASTCAVCKHFEASPCGDIFRRFLAASRRRDEKLKGVDKPEVRRAQNKEMSKEDAAEPQRSTQGDEKAGNGSDIGSERIVATGREHVRKTASHKNRATSSGRTRRKTKGGGGSSGGKDKRGAGKEGGEQQLKPEAIFQELRECSIFHDV